MASSTRAAIAGLIFGVFLGVGICLLFVFGLTTWSQQLADKRASDRLKTFAYQNAAVAADNEICSKIGRDILEGTGSVEYPGSAADAAIAAMLCTGIVNCHSTGIGGGHFSVAYNRATGNTTVVNAREKAPSAAYSDMYRENPSESKIGGLAIAVPGEVKGFYELWKSEGRLPWDKLFEPSIQLARNGFEIGGALAFAIEKYAKNILEDENLRNIFTDEKGTLLKEGNIVKFPQLADTLENIAFNGSYLSFYTGTLANTIAKEIRQATSVNKTGVTVEDLSSYDANVEEPVEVQYDTLTLYAPQPPASGVVVSFILNILEGYHFTPCSVSSNPQCSRGLQYHRIVETFKFAFAQRADLKDGVSPNITDMLTSKEYSDKVRRRITDDMTQPPEYYTDGDGTVGLYEEGGTSHVSVVDEFGNAVAISGSINRYFGSLVLGADTGIFYNNQMDDFAFNLDHLPANSIEPGKRPLSSMTPTIMVNANGDAGIVAGGAGSLSITTATALVIANTLWFEDDVYSASTRPRLHYPANNQLYVTTYEDDVSNDIIDELKLKGHNLTEHNNDNGPLSVIQLVTRKNQKIYAKSDHRKAGFGEAGF